MGRTSSRQPSLFPRGFLEGPFGGFRVQGTQTRSPRTVSRIVFKVIALSRIYAVTAFTAPDLDMTKLSGKEKAHKHKQNFPVTARVGRVSRPGGGGGLPTGGQGSKFMCCVRNPKNINIFVRVPGREDSGTRPGGSVTGVTEKLFTCQMFMCLFRPLNLWELQIR